MALGEMIVAGIVLAVCLVMLVRLALGPARRERLDRALVNAWHRGPMRAWHAFEARRARRRREREDAARRAAAAKLEAFAERETVDAIARARDRASGRAPAPSGPGGSGTRPEADTDGNVIRPKAFRRPEPGATHPGNDTRH